VSRFEVYDEADTSSSPSGLGTAGITALVVILVVVLVVVVVVTLGAVYRFQAKNRRKADPHLEMFVMPHIDTPYNRF
jgi:heme/copper-type cytochrome/quinol oxidase subunit 2